MIEGIEKFAAQFPDAQKKEFRDETTFTLSLTAIKDALRFCKETLGFDMMMDISSVDNFGDEPRFELVYELYSFAANCYLRLKTSVSEDALEAPTVSDLWATADWHEREIFDMMGIRFSGHPDLRRILMWDGYPFFPLRKDFPIEGKPTEMPDVAFSKAAPLAGGPFITVPSSATVKDREPRARDMENLPK